MWLDSEALQRFLHKITEALVAEIWISDWHLEKKKKRMRCKIGNLQVWNDQLEWKVENDHLEWKVENGHLEWKVQSGLIY